LELSLDADLLIEPMDELVATMLKDAVGHESASNVTTAITRTSSAL
jgi:hypothetical protein